MIIGNIKIHESKPTYFIADIGSNHNGSLEQAIRLISLAAAAGANAIKFQHFRAEHIVSDVGFKSLGKKLGHQENWEKSVYDTYKQYETPWDWTPLLTRECFKNNVHFLSTPYDFEAVDHLEPFVSAFKIGSGDINYFELLEKMASTDKPIILSTGASTLDEIYEALNHLEEASGIAILQCNSNYMGNLNSFNHLNLNVIRSFQEEFIDIHIGLSDHTHGHVAVLGAVALGARIIEKHFTNDNTQEGPDHSFALNPASWRNMVADVRLLETALGDGVKIVEKNEEVARLIQRRGLWCGKRLRPAND